jgi:predicted dehydrogenase
MVDKVRIGMIGTSAIAQNGHLFAQSHHPNAETVAICGRNQERARKVAAKFEIPQVFTDYREMIKKADLDAVVIAGPSYAHFPMIMAALEAKLHVHTQSPLGLTRREAAKACAAAHAAGVKHMVFFNPRIYSTHLHLKQMIDDGFVGKLWQCDFQYLTGRNLGLSEGDWRDEKAQGSFALHLCIHMADMAHWYAGPVRNVSASLSTFKPLPQAGGETAEPAEDSAILLVEFENGAHGTIYGSGVAALESFHHHVTVRGDEGALQLSHSLTHGWSLSGGRAADESPRDIELPPSYLEGIDISMTPFEQIRQYIAHNSVGDRAFVDSILTDAEIAPTFDDGLAAHCVIDAAIQSAETGRRIEVKYGSKQE